MDKIRVGAAHTDFIRVAKLAYLAALRSIRIFFNIYMVYPCGKRTRFLQNVYDTQICYKESAKYKEMKFFIEILTNTDFSGIIILRKGNAVSIDGWSLTMLR